MARVRWILVGLVFLTIGAVGATADRGGEVASTEPVPQSIPFAGSVSCLASDQALELFTADADPVPVEACNFWSAISCRGKNVGDPCPYNGKTCQKSGTIFNGCECK